MKPYLLLFLLTLGGLSGFSQDAPSLYREAGEAYLKKDYRAAITAWEQVLQLGLESAPLYYNLGNAYFKTNQLPQAIWYYEKSLKLSPGDADARFNLALANSRIIDKIEPLPLLFYHRWWSEIRSMQSTDGWAVLALTLMTIFLCSTALYLLLKKNVLRKISFWLAAASLVFTFFAFTFAWQSHQQRLQRKDAIIFAPAVNVKSSPDHQSVDLFVLHEGTKVQLTDELGEWVKVLIANGNVGWIQVETLKVI